MLGDEQMSKRWPCSLLNDEQMSNWVGVKHLPVTQLQTGFFFPVVANAAGQPGSLRSLCHNLASTRLVPRWEVVGRRFCRFFFPHSTGYTWMSQELTKWLVSGL